jgi:shikimate kinase
MATSMKGAATCHGAATLINGIVIGKGASFGIGLTTTAQVKLTNEPGTFNVVIENDPEEDGLLSKTCVEHVLREMKIDDQYGADIVTRSDIPISRGLKSSSAASNALILAALKALGEKWDDMTVINAGVDASLRAGVTITGAFDDACAAYFGGISVTNNLERKLIDRFTMDDDLIVLIHVPDQKIRKTQVDKERLHGIEPVIEKAFRMVLNKNLGPALTMNGLSYGSAMGLDTTISEKAIEAGAYSAGISGTGPATVILCYPEYEDPILKAIGRDRVIRTRSNQEKARMH